MITDKGYLICGNNCFKNGLCYCKLSDRVIKGKCFCLIEFIEGDVKND